MVLLPLLLLALIPSISTTAYSSRTIIILAGQSNMSGRGGVTNNTWDRVTPPECQPSPSIQRFTSGLQWEEARDPLHADIDVYAVTGVGPGMPFATSVLRRRPGAALGLVPCAVGNTGIDQWSKGAEFYEKMVARVRAAVAGGEGGVVGAVLWYQGEKDTVNLVDAQSYKGKMERMVSDLRVDLGLPDLLVIQVALASGQGKYLDLVRQQQFAVRLPNFATVDAKGQQLSHDYVHLTTAGEVEVGKMLANAYLAATHH